MALEEHGSTRSLTHSAIGRLDDNCFTSSTGPVWRMPTTYSKDIPVSVQCPTTIFCASVSVTNKPLQYAKLGSVCTPKALMRSHKLYSLAYRTSKTFFPDEEGKQFSIVLPQHVTSRSTPTPPLKVQVSWPRIHVTNQVLLAVLPIKVAGVW